MNSFWTRNLNSNGRLIRGVLALFLLAGACFGFQQSVWLGGLLLVFAAFVAFEAVCGWCALRACGIKTRW